MSQASLTDEDLFGEAANEMREDVESSLAAARDELPAADEIWETDADNVLGALNGLKSALDVGAAESHLRDAKKWYTMGERADAFDDADDLAADIETVESTVETVEAAEKLATDLTSTMPELRGTLQEATAEDEGDEAEDEE